MTDSEAVDGDLRVEGPVVNETTGAMAYTAREGSHTMHFSVLRSDQEWDVEIEGLPEPGILHDDPWTTPEMARDAALRFVRSMLDIERLREESERSYNPGADDSCVDQTGGLS